jgi:hypothetical protein
MGTHRFPGRNFRAPDEEFAPATEAIKAGGLDVQRVLRAALRWIRDDPDTALATLQPHLPDEAPRGRPPRAGRTLTATNSPDSPPGRADPTGTTRPS